MSIEDKILEKDLNDCQEQLLLMLIACFRTGPMTGYQTIDVVLFAAALMTDKTDLSIETAVEVLEGYSSAIEQFKQEQENDSTFIFNLSGEA